MKVLLSVVLTLLAIVPALCWPVNDDVKEPYAFANVNPGVQDQMFQDYPPETQRYVDDTNYYAAFQDDGKEPPLPKEVADELRKQVESERNKGGQVEVQATSSGRVLGHGCTVALQLMLKDFWLGCPFPDDKCAGAGCPQLYFEGNDWTRCWGEVFRLYRAAGPGNILNGDFVGLYYPRENKWFSMFQGFGRLLTCPGNPSTAHGFQDFQKWFQCGAEVFQIYAKGKPIRATITDQDTISLYYPTDIRNVVFGTNGAALSQCMLEKSSFSLPPNNQAFDECKYMSVDITIRD